MVLINSEITNSKSNDFQLIRILFSIVQWKKLISIIILENQWFMIIEIKISKSNQSTGSNFESLFSDWNQKSSNWKIIIKLKSHNP